MSGSIIVPALEVTELEVTPLDITESRGPETFEERLAFVQGKLYPAARVLDPDGSYDVFETFVGFAVDERLSEEARELALRKAETRRKREAPFPDDVPVGPRAGDTLLLPRVSNNKVFEIYLEGFSKKLNEMFDLEKKIHIIYIEKYKDENLLYMVSDTKLNNYSQYL